MSTKIICILSLICCINSLYIYVDGREKKCLSDFRMKNYTFEVIYYVSGQEEEKNIVTIQDANHRVYVTSINRKHDKLRYVPNADGVYSFCFDNLSTTRVTLNFAFDYGIDDYSILSIHTIENFVLSVKNLETKIGRLQFNIRNSAIRKIAHFNIADSIRKKINTAAIVKIAFLILFSVFQLMMITSIFNNVKVVKQININSEKRPLKSNKNNYNEGTDFL